MNLVIVIVLASFSRSRLDKLICQAETIQVYWLGFCMQKYKKHAKSTICIMD